MVAGVIPIKRPRRNHSPVFKVKLALEAVRGEKTIAQLAAHYDTKKVILLIASYYFYMCWSTRYIFVI